MKANGQSPDLPDERYPIHTLFRDVLDLVDQTVAAVTDAEVDARLQQLLEMPRHGSHLGDDEAAQTAHEQTSAHGEKPDPERMDGYPPRSWGGPVRLLTNIGRLWTGSEILTNAALITAGERIVWVGPAVELPQRIPGVVDDIVDVDHVENLGGGLVTPGLIDTHTHPVYAGNRWGELAMRSSGSSTNEIAIAGGGIASTVTITRGTDPWTLCNGVRARLAGWLESGTTTIEAKTGYHLTREGELADVRLLRSLEEEPGMPRVHVTFFAAHAVPPEYFGRRHEYIDAVSLWCSDAAAAGADSIDVYCEEGRFSEAEARWILGAGRATGLLPRLHACGQSRTGAVSLAAELGCASADMLNEANDDDVAALAHAGVAAVVCPSTALQSGRRPPVRALLDKGVAVALGTDHGPASNRITSMSLVISLAIAYFGMSVTEALRAATIGGSHALRAPDRGALVRGRYADLVLWDADHEGAFIDAFGLKPQRVWRGGELITS
jgi:imidazolonepropionase